MEQLKTQNSRLFVTNSVEGRDDVEEKYERSYHVLQRLTTGLSEKEIHDALNNAVCKGAQNYEEVSLGLLVSILNEPQNASRHYRDLNFISRDGLNLVIGHLNQLIADKFPKLLDSVREQFLWLLRETMKNSIIGVDGVCWNLMRHMAGGDVSVKNIWLIENLLNIYIENRSWLEKFPLLVASVVYTYLRLIEDHSSPVYSQLRQKEVQFVVQLIRDRFPDCLVLGRDLVRLLQNVARIPEFDKLWKDLLNNPSSLCSNFPGITALLQTRTSRKFLQSRLTPDMEKKVVFLTNHVRFGNHKRYQDWFQKQYLTSQESQTLRCDLIRFIVGVIHPPNELLCSDIIPRWAIIGWLLTTCTSNVAASNAKLALFYDWLFFDPERDNIMNIEPAILVMHQSMRSHPAITATLLDFLCRIIPHFYPPLMDQVKLGVHNSLRQILEKGVLSNLSPLFDNPKLDRELKTMILDNFGDFCAQNEVKNEENHQAHPRDSFLPVSSILGDVEIKLNHEVGAEESSFSDEEDDNDKLRIVIKEEQTEEKNDTNLNIDAKLDLSEHVEPFDSSLKEIMTKLVDSGSSERHQVLDQVYLYVMEQKLSIEVIRNVAACLCKVLEHDIEHLSIPITEEKQELLNEFTEDPVNLIFSNLYEYQKEKVKKDALLSLLSEMYDVRSQLGYYFLCYLKARNLCSPNLSPFREFCEFIGMKTVDKCLVDVLQICLEDDVNVFCWLIPDVYSQLSAEAVGNSELLYLVVSCIDASQLHQLVCQILLGHMIMFKVNSFLDVLSASLEWETFEQLCVWHLIAAHNIPVGYVLPILPKLKYPQHSEYLSSILIMLKQEKPTIDLLKQLLMREVQLQDFFVASVLHNWSQHHEDNLADLISSQLCKTSTPVKRKRNQPQNKNVTLTNNVDNVLGHIDVYRQCCKQPILLNHDVIQQALQNVWNQCSDSQKDKYKELFAMTTDAEVKTPISKLSRGRKSTLSPRATKKPTIVEVSSDSESEEEVIKPRTTKKRRKANPVGSDSE